MQRNCRKFLASKCFEHIKEIACGIAIGAAFSAWFWMPNLLALVSVTR